jgi:hypothetical protein
MLSIRIICKQLSTWAGTTDIIYCMCENIFCAEECANNSSGFCLTFNVSVNFCIYNLKGNLKEVDCEDGRWMKLVQNDVHRWASVLAVLSLWVYDQILSFIHILFLWRNMPMNNEVKCSKIKRRTKEILERGFWGLWAFICSLVFFFKETVHYESWIDSCY